VVGKDVVPKREGKNPGRGGFPLSWRISKAEGNSGVCECVGGVVNVELVVPQGLEIDELAACEQGELGAELR
jgi:hypothetical protein